MIKRCRFCGEKIKSDDAVCPHCGKQLIAQSKSDEDSDSESLVGLNRWEGKTVPSWMMFVALGIAFLCVFAMFNQGCNRDDDTEAEPENAMLLPFENSEMGDSLAGNQIDEQRNIK